MPIIIAPFFFRKCIKISIYSKSWSNDKKYINYNSNATIKDWLIKFLFENKFYHDWHDEKYDRNHEIDDIKKDFREIANTSD